MNPKRTYRLIILPILMMLIVACRENTAKTNKSPRQNNVKGTVPGNSPDKSPLDMTYYPPEYPKLKMAGNVPEQLVARVIYSRPSVDGRQIFGTLLKFGKAWRLGANEATEIEFFQPVTIQNKQILPGRYILYCKPYESKWTLILNADLYTWGLKIDSTKDLYAFDVPVQRLSGSLEVFTMEFDNNLTGPVLTIAWDSIKTELPFNINKSPS